MNQLQNQHISVSGLQVNAWIDEDGPGWPKSPLLVNGLPKVILVPCSVHSAHTPEAQVYLPDTPTTYA